MPFEAYRRPQDPRYDRFLEELSKLLPTGWTASLQLEDPLTLLPEEVACQGPAASRELTDLLLAPVAEGLLAPPDPWLLERLGLGHVEILPLAGERPFGRVLLVAGDRSARLDPRRRRRLQDLCAASVAELERARAHGEDEKFAARLRRIAQSELAERFARACVSLLPSVRATAVLLREGEELIILRAWTEARGSVEEYLRRSLPWKGSHLEALLHGGDTAAILSADEMSRVAEGRQLYALIRQLTPACVETVPLETELRLAGSLLLFHDRTDIAAAERQATDRLAESLSRAFDRIRPERRQASSLLYLQELLRSSETGLEPVLRTVVEELVRFLGADAGVLVLVDSDSGKLLFTEQVGYQEETLPASLPRDGKGTESISGQVTRTGEPYLASDTRSSSVYLAADPTIQSEMGVPLRLRGETFGVALASSRTAGFFLAQDLARFQLFADQIALAVDNARLLDQFRQEHQKQDLRRQRQQFGFSPSAQAQDLEYHFGNLVGDPRGPMGGVYRAIERIAHREHDTVLIVGETGTGKEMVSYAIHNASSRGSRPLIATNFAALGGDPNLIQSELFGHEKGSFTGANRRRKGCFEMAHGSTLLIDELGDIVPSVQVKLLRVLGRSSTREFSRLGSEEAVRSDVRVLVATNKDLRSEIATGRFREDLYYRLSALVIRVPALRERPGDIPLLAHHILSRLQPEEKVGLQQEAIQTLQRYPWPGNVRQLESVLLRALVLFGKPTEITDDDVRQAFALELEEGNTGPPLAQNLFCPRPAPRGWFWEEVWQPFKEHRLERQAILDLLAETLAETGGYYTRVADRFGIARGEYQKFIDFLTHADLRLDFRPYRQSGASKEDTGEPEETP